MSKKPASNQRVYMHEIGCLRVSLCLARLYYRDNEYVSSL